MTSKDRKFGLLTVIKEIGSDIFLCRCACGNELELWRSQLVERIYRDCRKCDPKRWVRNHNVHTRIYKTRTGKIKHLRTREMSSYLSMLARCSCETNQAYETYGGRGIRVCKRWLPDGAGQGFKNFIADMGPRPLGKTLDRINPQGHYEPTNCRWADAETQTQNRRCMLYPDGDEPKLEGVRTMEARIAEEMDVEFTY
jgi:hypothetical protein